MLISFFQQRLYITTAKEYYKSKPPVLSLSMPIRSRKYEDSVISNWIAGLLPDRLHTDGVWNIQNMFSTPIVSEFDWLASKRGLDCAGAVQFSIIDNVETAINREGKSEFITESEIYEWFIYLFGEYPPIINKEDDGIPSAAYSISGMQVKIALRNINGDWYLPNGSLPTTHILKPSINGYEKQAIIEHLCMAVANNIKLDAANTRIETFGDIDTIIVERFDRVDDPNGLPKSIRIHMEDMCQALGIPANHKYQWDVGTGPKPTVEKISQLFFKSAQDPIKEISKFTDLLIYNFITHHNDAHAKNYSLYLVGAHAQMAPLYDSCSFIPYFGTKEIWLPMLIGNKDENQKGVENFNSKTA